MANLVVMEPTCELRLSQVGRDLLVRHLLETSLQEVDLSVGARLASIDPGRDPHRIAQWTYSSSLQARPPPAAPNLRPLETPALSPRSGDSMSGESGEVIGEVFMAEDT